MCFKPPLCDIYWSTLYPYRFSVFLFVLYSTNHVYSEKRELCCMANGYTTHKYKCKYYGLGLDMVLTHVQRKCFCIHTSEIRTKAHMHACNEYQYPLHQISLTDFNGRENLLSFSNESDINRFITRIKNNYICDDFLIFILVNMVYIRIMNSIDSLFD